MRTASPSCLADGSRYKYAVLRRLGLIVFGVLLAYLGLELVLRVTGAVPEVATPLYSFHENDRYLGWIGKPGMRVRYRRPEFDTLVQHDADGWRQAQPPRPTNPRHRVLVLGDSFTWGWGVAQGELFTDRLQARLPPDVAVYNRGLTGFGTAQEYLLLQRELAATRYHTVVLMFFINDLDDNINGMKGGRPYFELADGQLLARNQPVLARIGKLERFCKDHSRAYVFIEFQLEMLRRRLADRANDEIRYAELGTVDFHDLPGYPVTARLIAAMHDLARQHGARFFLAYIPQRSEFERESPLPYARSIHAMIDDITRREDIPLVDLVAPLSAEARAGRTMTYPIDAHWTPEAHQVVAEAMLASAIFQSGTAAEASDHNGGDSAAAMPSR